MPLALGFFLHYAYLILFLWVLAEQLGVPVPSTPILLTAGGLTARNLTATHRLSFSLVLLAVIAGCLVSDSIWYLLGKRFGGSVVKLLCRFSLESSACVRKTENYFTRHGPQALLVAKFIPGLNTVAAPIAGQSGMRFPLFVAYDFSGALLWGGGVTLAGRIFGDVLKQHPQALSVAGRFAGILLLAAILGILVYRIAKRQSFLKQVEMERVEPEDLKRMLDSGQQVFIVDLRHPLDYLPDPRVLPGAVRISLESLAARSAEVPRDRDIVLYCTCPNEASAAKAALKLRAIGVRRVRPLHGGFDLWKERGFPLEEYREEQAAVSGSLLGPAPLA